MNLLFFTSSALQACLSMHLSHGTHREAVECELVAQHLTSPFAFPPPRHSLLRQQEASSLLLKARDKFDSRTVADGALCVS